MEEVEKLAKELIRFKTVTGNHDEAEKLLSHIKVFLEDKWKIHSFVNNGFPCMVIGEEHAKIGMLGHIDVVPAPENMFEPKVQDNKLYARGAIDMKSQVAAMCVLLKHIEKKSVWLMLTSDEETGGMNGAKWLIDQGFVCDFFLVPDAGTNFKLVTREKGVLQLEITARGKSAHGSTPWKGVNAIELLMEQLKKIKALFEKDNKDKWVTTLTISGIQGGTATNQVPEEARAVLDIRYSDDPRELIERIEAIAEYRIINEGGLLTTNPNHPLVKSLAEIMKAQLGTDIKPSFEHGASDARFLAEKGIQGALFNPVGGGAHSPDEFIELSSIPKFYKILESFINQNA